MRTAGVQLAWREGPKADVVATLESQWRALRLPGGEEPVQARALALNLICRAHDSADAARMAQHLWDLGPRHPARVFLLEPSPASARPRMRVAAHPNGSEMIELQVPEAAGGRAAAGAISFIAPLLAGDLPVLLLWRGADPCGNPEFRQWAALANRVLVDAHRLHLSAPALAALAAEMPPGAHLGDLTWTRLTPWRQLLVQGLDGALANPTAITKVTITAGGVEDATNCGGRLAATLFAGWMAHKLDWRPRQHLPEGLRLDRPQGGPLLLRFENAHAHECLLPRVVVEGGEPSTMITLEHRGAHVAMTVSEAGQIVGQSMGASAGESLLRGEVATLAEELSIRGFDGLYQQSLQRGLELMAHWEQVAA